MAASPLPFLAFFDIFLELIENGKGRVETAVKVVAFVTETAESSDVLDTGFSEFVDVITPGHTVAPEKSYKDPANEKPGFRAGTKKEKETGQDY